jgi:fatty acid desaturase
MSETQQATGRSSTRTRGTARGPHASPRAPNRRQDHRMPVEAAASARRTPAAPLDGRRIDGLRPLWVFLLASLAIVAAVTVAGVVESWWILVPVMGVFFTATFGVLATIMWQLRDNGEPE